MAVREGTASAVFAGNAHAVTLFEQAGVSEVFGGAPVKRLFAVRHFKAGCHEFFNDGVRHEVTGQGVDFFAESGQRFSRIGGVDGGVPVLIRKGFPGEA